MTATRSSAVIVHVHPLVVVSAAVGLASLIANIVWNCNTCGWDPDGVPWYQPLLVVAVPFVAMPCGVLGLALRALLLRRRSAIWEFVGGSAGLLLPWAYYVVAYIRHEI